MAESIVAISTSKLKALLSQEHRLLHGSEDDITSLVEALDRVRPFLERIDRSDDRANQLISVAYDAEDALEMYVLHMKRRNRADRLFCCTNHVEIGSLRSEIDGLKRRAYVAVPSDVGNNGKTSSHLTEEESPAQLMVPISVEDVVVGFDEDTEVLARRLTVEGGRRRSVVSIVGMGGLGKTTLANKVYKHERVLGHFGHKGWVSVSQRYRERELLLGVAEGFWGKDQRERMEGLNEESLKGRIFEKLSSERYLLVIDNVWKVEAWEFLRGVLPDDSNGSRVLLTTRIRDVAESADPMTPPYELRLLRRKESWELLCRKAFPHLRGRCPPVFEEVGKKIAGKCGGLPLQIVVLGGLLREKKKHDDWVRVLEGVDWDLSLEDRTSRVLALSYAELPGHLKPCFLYFTHYPEDSKILTRKLFRKWVAEGLVQGGCGEERLVEELAEDYLGEMIRRCLVQVVEMNSNGCVKTCRIHDLLLELSISEARRDVFLHVYSDDMRDEDLKKARRISLQETLSDGQLVSSSGTPMLLRSLLCSRIEKLELRSLFKGSKLLQVIDLDHVPITKLPDEIGGLIFLRYLGLRNTKITEFPSSAGKLLNLQTLDLKVADVEPKPETIWNMHNLRHLCCHSIFYSYDPRRMRFDSLTNLQTLRSACSGEWIDRGLSKLTNLRRLALYHKFKESFHPALRDRLSKLVHLNQLSLSGHSTLPALCSFRNHHHLTKLSFIIRLERLQDVEEHPPNLRKLKLRGSELKEDPMPVLEKVESLHILSFDNVYIGQKMWCSARGFPRLEVLILWKMHHLEEWTIEGGALSRLKRLEINDCRNLKMLPEGLQHVTTLGELELMWMSAEFRERVRMNTGCDWYKIRHVPRINIEGTDICESDKDEDSEGIKPKKNRIKTYIR